MSRPVNPFNDLGMDSGDAQHHNFSFSQSHPNSTHGDFWDAALGLQNSFSGMGLPDSNFHGMFGGAMEEEFFDAAKVLNGHQDSYGIKFSANPDLDKSGLRDDIKVQRTESMSPADSDDRISVNRYFQRRSAYSTDGTSGSAVDQLAFLGKRGNQDRDFEGYEVENRRSTLTKHDLLDIIDANDANRVRKQKGPASVCSTDSSLRSSIGTVAAMEELDRILADVSSSDDDISRSPTSRPVDGQRSQPLPPKSQVPASFFPASQSNVALHRDVRNFAPSQTAVPKVPSRYPTEPSINSAAPSKITQSVRNPPSSPTKTGGTPTGFQKSFEIDSAAVKMLDSLLEGPSARDRFVRPPAPTKSSQSTGFPARREVHGTHPQPLESTGGNDTVLVDSKTEEILRRANNVLARVERMKKGQSPEPIPLSYSTYPAGDEQLQAIKRPRLPVSSTTEPKSAPQAKDVTTSIDQSYYHNASTRHAHTETMSVGDHYTSAMDTTNDASLLEQTTYPVARSSQELRDVVLATHRIFFPPTEVDESSTAKLQIKNYTALPCQLRFFFTRESSVFTKRYDNLTIQPRRFLNVPLRFSPHNTGYFETKMRVTVEGPIRKEMTVDIVGEGIARLTY